MVTKNKQESGPLSPRGSGSAKTLPNNKPKLPSKNKGASHAHKHKSQRLEQQLTNYRCTDIYTKAYERKFNTQGALDTFNLWVVNNKEHIDPACMPVCLECGACDLMLCNHFINGFVDPAVKDELGSDDGVVVVDEAAPILISRRHRGFVNGILRWFITHRDPSFDLNINNNHNCKYFDNVAIPDDYINSDLYLFIRSKMHAKYPSRDVKIEHCLRLAEVFDTKNKVSYSTPLALNRRMITVQKACDSHENDVLLAHNDPQQQGSFSKAWAFVVVLVILMLLLHPAAALVSFIPLTVTVIRTGFRAVGTTPN